MKIIIPIGLVPFWIGLGILLIHIPNENRTDLMLALYTFLCVSGMSLIALIIIALIIRTSIDDTLD